MPKAMLQVVPREALALIHGSELGVYHTEFPSSMCFGSVVHGGIMLGYAQNAAIDFVSKSRKTTTHQHLWYLNVSFFRPTFATPQRGWLHISIASANKKWTTVHIEFKQNEKPCMAGYLTLTDFSIPGRFSANTGWQLCPTPFPMNIKSLEADDSPDWVSFVVPFTATKTRKAQTYMKYYVPMKQHSPNSIDQWVTPYWQDDKLPGGAVWTNDLIPFVVDNDLPVLNAVIGHEGSLSTFHEDVVRIGLEQRRARSEGKDDVSGKILSDTELVPVIVSTLSMSVEIKKPLPETGTKWLFLRASTKLVLNDRMDYEVVALDEAGDLVALSQQTVLVISAEQKNARKRAAL